MEATTSRLNDLPATISPAPNVASNESVASGTPARPEDMSAITAPAMSPTVETPVSPPPSESAAAVAKEQEANAGENVQATEKSAVATETASAFAAASSTPATSLAPSHMRESSRPAASWVDGRSVIFPRSRCGGFGNIGMGRCSPRQTWRFESAGPTQSCKSDRSEIQRKWRCCYGWCRSEDTTL